MTLFSSAAAICCRRKASCIFWAAGSSSRALMIWGKVPRLRPQPRRGYWGPPRPCLRESYLIIVLLCVLVELVQRHKGVK